MESFSELTLSPEVMRAIKDLGYETPSTIQAQALPILLGDATDFMGLAATGTGKTAAFGIPMLEKIDANVRSVQALIMCPTRELAMQVAGQIDLLGKYKGIKALPIYGGSGYGEQIHGLRNGAQVVVGTPGRLTDHIENGRLKLDQLQVMILDEADEMISMGFKEDMEKIMAAIPKGQGNTWLFSATMSREVSGIAARFLKKPKSVHVNRTEVVSTQVEQIYYMTHEGNKPEVLCKLVDAAHDFYGMVFCQTKALVSDLTQYLAERGYKVDSLHGDKDQKSRERTTQAFRDKKIQILVCTDVASRGLDVKDVTHVVNYSLPRELDNYVHRIGRTARSGKAGIAMSLVTPSHRRLIFAIERTTKSRMIEGNIPTRKDIGAKKVTKIMEKFQEAKHFERAMELLGPELKETLSKMTAEEITGRFLALTFPEIFADSLEVQMNKPAPRASAERGERSYGGAREERSYERKSYGGDREGGRSQRWGGKPPRMDTGRYERGAGAPVKRFVKSEAGAEGAPVKRFESSGDAPRPVKRFPKSADGSPRPMKRFSPAGRSQAPKSGFKSRAARDERF